MGNTYIIPFGNAASSTCIPFSFDITTAGTGASGYISAATYPTDPLQSPNNRPLPLGVNALLNINGTDNSSKTVDRFWLLHAGDYASEPISTLHFSYNDADWALGNNTINESNLQAQRLDGTTWSYPMLGWGVAFLNQVTVDNVAKYDTIWTLADNSSPLPVTLLSFDAELRKDQSVMCEWVTAAQLNNDHFEVERSKNGIDFEFVGTINGAGNSTSMLNYSLVDEKPFTGLSYYRLKQVDFDGRSTYSETRTIMVGIQGLTYLAYPNPATTELNLSFSEEAEFEGTLRVVDLNGNIVLEKNALIGAARQHARIDLANIAAGNYILQVISDDQFDQKQISVVK